MYVCAYHSSSIGRFVRWGRLRAHNKCCLHIFSHTHTHIWYLEFIHKHVFDWKKCYLLSIRSVCISRCVWEHMPICIANICMCACVPVVVNKHVVSVVATAAMRNSSITSAALAIHGILVTLYLCSCVCLLEITSICQCHLCNGMHNYTKSHPLM